MGEVIENEAGQVALKYYLSNPRLVEFSDAAYYFQPIANISLAWVHAKHVLKILALTNSGRCCGANKKPIFFYANESDVRRWSRGGGR